MSPMRVTAVLTHPVQYYAAWFRWIHANVRAIDLHVVYGSAPTPEQQGAGFDRAFAWDIPLTDGYTSTIVRAARPSDRFDAGHFRGLDVPEIGDAIGRTNPHVVVVFGWYSITLTRAIRAARRLQVPVLYHGDSNLQSAPPGWRRVPWLTKTRWLLSQFSAGLAVGVRSAAFLRYFGVPDDRIFQTPHCVDNDRFAEAASWRRDADRRGEIRQAYGIPSGAFVVLFAGKLESKKRPVDLVNALTTLAAMPPVPHLLIAGSGPLEPAVREAAERLGVACTHLGFVNQSDIPRVYAAADCLALPSDARETWGLVVNEALAAGLPCVVSDEAGCAPDLAGAATGGVYATAEPTERVPNLAAALASVRDRLRAGHDFTAACQTRAASYSFERAATGLERACTAAIDPPRAAPASRGAVRVVACCGGMVLVGGLERMTFEILRVLRERATPVHCVVNGWDNSRIVAMADNIGASWSTGFYWHLFTWRIRRPLIMLRMGWDMVRTSAGLLRDAWGFRASHVFVSDHITTLRNLPALWLLRLSGRRVILRLGNAPDPGRFYRWVWRYGVSPAVDRFVCNSAYTEQALAAHGITQSKRQTIPHTPPTRPPAPASANGHDPRRLIYVGQVIPEKGLDLLLDAVGLLVAGGRDVRLDVAGRMDGWAPPANLRHREQLVARAGAPDLAGRVRFLGYREDVPQLLAAAAIHCVPSRAEQREAFGVVVVEAKQAGIPSVVMPSGALPELIAHADNGWICREYSAEALADGIGYFLDADHLQRGMASARASAATYSRERFEQAWGSVFDEVSE